MFNHITGQILSMTHSVPIEINNLSPVDKDIIFTKIAETKYSVHEALDGTLFRYSYLPEQKEWILSTNSKEDAFTAYWMNGISLGQQFISIDNINLDVESFDKNHVHMFVMCHPLNIIVVNHEQPKIYHISTYDRTKMAEIDIDIGISKPPLLTMTLSEVLTSSSLENKCKPVTSAGYVISIQNGDTQTRYRFENFNYTQAKQLRGNSNNISYTLLELLSLHLSGGRSAVSEFIGYYPIYNDEYISLITRVNNLVAKLYYEYGRRYKSRVKINVHTRHHNFLHEIHQKLYKDTLKTIGKTVQYMDIHKFLLSQDPARVLYMINYIYDVVDHKYKS